MRKSILGLSAVLLATVATPALAQEIAGTGLTVSGNAALTSDYRFRGVSYSGGDIAIQGGFDVSHESGFYVGTWASSIDGGATYGHTEVDVYGGWSGEVTPGLTFDAGLLYYVYPNGTGDSDYFEPYASVSGTLGPVEAELGVAYAWDGQNALGDQDNLYVYTDLSAGIPNTPITLNGHVGWTDGVLSFDPDGESFDWSVGADYAITPNISFGVSYVGVEAFPSIDGLTDDTAVATLSFSF
ncbi:MAG: hypothetical protein JJE34_02205 [Alphaproteobacteria bacterium]|nr:hypothetical protein [Alphaproteobacteria bacterium]